MKIVIDIPDVQYGYLLKIVDAGEEPVGYYERVIMHGIPLKEWLSSFNTDSATECFTAVQRLKESVYDK